MTLQEIKLYIPIESIRMVIRDSPTFPWSFMILELVTPNWQIAQLVQCQQWKNHLWKEYHHLPQEVCHKWW